jgi:hypothetical protein
MASSGDGFDPAGSKPWLGYKRMVSSGSASLDAYLGGGLTLGSLVLLEADSGAGDLATTMARLFVAQAGPSSHRVSLAAASTSDVADLCTGVPRLATRASAPASGSEAASRPSETEPVLGSARQYRGYVMAGGDTPLHERSGGAAASVGAGPSSFRAAGAPAATSRAIYCSAFDLDRPIAADKVAFACGVDRVGAYRNAGTPALDSLVSQAQQLLCEPPTTPGVVSSRPSIRRVVLWGLPEQLSPSETLCWVSRVARMCRAAPHACVMLRLPCLHQCEARLGRTRAARLLRHGDSVIRVAAFGQEAGAGHVVRPPSGFGTQYSGLARLARLPLTPRLAPAGRRTGGSGSGGSGSGGAGVGAGASAGSALLLVRRTRRKLELEPMHLPPEGEQARPRQSAGTSTGGAESSSSLAAAVKALHA